MRWKIDDAEGKFEAFVSCSCLVVHRSEYLMVFFQFLFSAVKSTNSTTESQDKPSKAQRCEAEVPWDVPHNVLRWRQGRAASSFVRFLRVRRLRDLASHGNDVCGVELYREVSHHADETTRVAVWSLQALQRRALPQLPPLLLRVTNGACVNCLFTKF